MLRGNVGQPLQVVPLCQEAAEPLHGLVVAGAGAVAARPVVPVQSVQLVDQVQIILRHTAVLSVKKGRSSPNGAVWLFPAIFRDFSWPNSASGAVKVLIQLCFPDWGPPDQQACL